jgi:hypothetical protein
MAAAETAPLVIRHVHGHRDRVAPVSFFNGHVQQWEPAVFREEQRWLSSCRFLEMAFVGVFAVGTMIVSFLFFFY